MRDAKAWRSVGSCDFPKPVLDVRLANVWRTIPRAENGNALSASRRGWPRGAARALVNLGVQIEEENQQLSRKKPGLSLTKWALRKRRRTGDRDGLRDLHHLEKTYFTVGPKEARGPGRIKGRHFWPKLQLVHLQVIYTRQRKGFIHLSVFQQPRLIGIELEVFEKPYRLRAPPSSESPAQKQPSPPGFWHRL